MISKKRRNSIKRCYKKKKSLRRRMMSGGTTRTEIFKRNIRKSHDFEMYLTGGKEAAVLNATSSNLIPLTYFVTPSVPLTAPDVLSAEPRSKRKGGGLADKMEFETFRLINLQERGSHAHSLVLFKSRAITTNPEQISIFECNGKGEQSEIRVLMPDPSKSDGSTKDITTVYFSPLSPERCINFGSSSYNPGYCGIFGIIAMVFFRHFMKTSTPEEWIRKWQIFLNYMSQRILGEPPSHGGFGTLFASRVLEIIDASKGFKAAEKQIIDEIEEAVLSM
jgi:hypothetical protein